VISAVQNGKYSVERIEVERIEDVITASVFDTLLLLPGERVWQILCEACYDKENWLKHLKNKEAGELEYDKCEFWPQWDSTGTTNKRYVEPDVFIPFEKLDLLIEAKRDGKQTREQWKRELRSYGNEYNTEKDVLMLAVEGVSDNKDSEDLKLQGRETPIKVGKTDWERLLEVLQREQSRKKHKNDTKCRILQMAINWLTHFGYGMTWLDELVKVDKENTESIAALLAIQNFDADLDCLQNFCIMPDITSTDDEDSAVWLCDMLDTGLSISNYGKDLTLLKTFGGQDE
jgi:hypothetical protein